MTNSHFRRQIWGICLAALMQLGETIPMPKRAQGGILRLPVSHKNVAATHQRRQVGVPLENTVRSYTVQLELGTPSQAVMVTLDTGSSDLWVYGPGSCTTCEGGVYDPTLSSTANNTDLPALNIEYFDGTKDQGYYVTDDVVIAGTTVTSAVVGVATTTPDRSYSIFGIGLDGLEAVSNPYPNFIDDLWAQGIITTHGYSLYLDDLESSTGELILGGIDTSKYSGDLVALPIVASTDGAERLSVNWSSFTIADPQGSTATYTPSPAPYPVVLDTGYTFSVLPNDLFNDLVNYFGVQSTTEGYMINCDQPNGYIDIGFGNDDFTLSIPFSEIAVPNFADASGGCFFGFQAAGSNSVISFGDTVLRSAYVVYNYDARTISLAQASFDQSCANCAGAI